jgi:hypothetical protein
MRLLELFEAGGDTKHATFCFGRMNPPTIGHKALINKVANAGGDYYIFPSRPTPKTKKLKLANPLDVETKIQFIKQIFSSQASHIVDDPRLNTFLTVCTYLYDKGYNHVTIVAGSDRLDELISLCKQYNGVEGTAHGYYKFETIDGESSGARDPDSEGVEGSSGTKAREAAIAGDFTKFQQVTGAGEHAEELYKAVRKGLGVKDSVEEHIVKVKGGYELKSKKTGRNLGKYPTRAGAEKRERQVQYFKHAG